MSNFFPSFVTWLKAVYISGDNNGYSGVAA